MNTDHQKALPGTVKQWYVEPIGSLSNENIAKLLEQLAEESICQGMTCADGETRNMYKVSARALVSCAASISGGLAFKAFGDEGQGIIPFTIVLGEISGELSSRDPMADRDPKQVAEILGSVLVKRSVPRPQPAVPQRGVKPWNARKPRQAASKAPSAAVHRLHHH